MMFNNEEVTSNILRSYLFQNFGNYEIEDITNSAICRTFEAGERISEFFWIVDQWT